jgi:hypothetical protein
VKENFIVVSKVNLLKTPQKKHYILETRNSDELLMIGDVVINGSIVAIANSFEEAEQIVNNLTSQ